MNGRGTVRRHPAACAGKRFSNCLVAGHRSGRRLSPRLVLEIGVGERLPVLVADDEADRPRRREAAGGHFRVTTVSLADPGLQPGGRMMVKARRFNPADLPIVKEQPARSWTDTRAGSKCNPTRTPCSPSRSRFRRSWAVREEHSLLDSSPLANCKTSCNSL